ncbi:uncharacterized protein LOC106086753 isoform X1 [Stomoxys calcitrans]|uniref:uncharacterized protein LOC106086753 isoform X1 n=2 Tax=Stomoxys calcitrans TaxID=35570 RepID=UPI0027E37D95|nr:uncharacterized protein LOC106086753 isoform X1 [Stomoxys calcitrans]
MEKPKGDQVLNFNNNEVPIALRAVEEVQQDLAATCTLQSQIVWDILGPDQGDILVKKLEHMFPEDTKVYKNKPDVRKARRHNANIKEIRAKLFHNIWQQRKYTNGVLLHSIIYVIVTPDTDLEKAKLSHNYTIHPVFRTRRCLNSNNSAGCCMIFIDEQSRIYQNWSDFMENNQMPIGTMVAPVNGCYGLDKNGKVLLQCSLTPAYYKQSLAKMDTLVSAASMVGQATTLIHPAFSALTIASKSFETIRDYQKRADNVAHATESQMSAILNLGGNVICLTSLVATFGAYMAVSNNCAMSFTAGMSIQAINSAAALINCTKLILTTYDIFTRYFIDEQNLDFGDIMAFGSSLLLLTNSINNVAITSQLGKVGGNALRNLLQSKIKAGLSLIAGEMVRFAEQSGGSCDLIRLVNDIPYGEVLRTIHTIYRNLKQNGFLTTISAVGMMTLEVGPGLSLQVNDKEITQLDINELTKVFGSKFVKHIGDASNLVDVLNGMGLYFSEAIIQLLFKQTHQFIDVCVDAIEKDQNIFITSEMVLYKMFSFVVKNYKDLSLDYLYGRRDDLIDGVRQYFESLNPNISSDINNNIEYKCNVCGGYYNLAKI